MDTENNHQQLSEADIVKEAYRLLELTLQKADIYKAFDFSIFFRSELTQYSDREATIILSRLRQILNHLDYINNSCLTPLGLEVKKIGGHAKYVKFLEAKEQAVEAKEKAELDNLRSSTRLNDNLYKMRWWPLGISIAALALSVWVFVDSKMNNSNENKTKPVVQTSIAKDTITKTQNVTVEKKINTAVPEKK